jgi:hypothetical protein
MDFARKITWERSRFNNFARLRSLWLPFCNCPMRGGAENEEQNLDRFFGAGVVINWGGFFSKQL